VARDYAHVNVDIWNDDDFRALPALAQHLYLTLWTNAGLSYCGVMDWRPGRLAALSGDLSRDDIRLLADCLEARLFIVTDDDTEEVLVRSWVRWDGLLKQPRLAVSYVNAFGEVSSNDIRGVIVHEAARLQEREPGLVGWKNPRVQNLLKSKSMNPRDRALPSDPFGDEFGPGLGIGLPQGLGKGLPETLGSVSGSVSIPPTPAPTPAPLAPAPEKPRKRGSRLPEDWTPNDKHRSLAAELGVDLDAEAAKMRDHALANGRTQKDWDAYFRNWLRNSLQFGGQQRPNGQQRAVGVNAPGDEWMRRPLNYEWEPPA
jgi:hypothetical protein